MRHFECKAFIQVHCLPENANRDVTASRRRNPSVDFHGERRQNATHQSTTDPEARLAKKGAGKEAKLCYTESVLMENRNGIMMICAWVRPPEGPSASMGWSCCKRFAGRAGSPSPAIKASILRSSWRAAAHST
jgi:hypothetical protein